MQEMGKFLRKYRSQIIIGGVVLGVVIALPFLLNEFIINNNYPSQANPDGWASFFGSYLGGVLGGFATLIAVIITISSNRKEQERKSIEEKIERARKSALIIYYDFDFAFDNIIKFKDQFPDSLPTDEVVKTYISNRKYLNQFYLDSNWINTVAQLKDSTDFSIQEIKMIYEIYGHLMNIRKGLDVTDKEIITTAYDSMRSLTQKVPEKEVKESLRAYVRYKDFQNNKYAIAIDYWAIKNKLYEVAFAERATEDD